jgi:glyoxylase-like metal-dependent hydrolase (beta-lactamase superfamily II)
MEIAPNIHLIPALVGTRPLQLFLLTGDQRTVLLDTGCAPDPEKYIFPYIKELGMTPADIDIALITHCDVDHCGGNSALKRANPDVLITCGDADRLLVEDPAVIWARRYDKFTEPHGMGYSDSSRQWNMENLGEATPVDWTWRGDESLRLGKDWLVEIHHVPGHSDGHLAVFDPKSRTILSGDAVHGAIYLDVDGNPALCPTYLDVDPYLETISYLRGLGADQLAGCHWPVKRGSEIDAFLDESQQFVEKADLLLLAELDRRGSATLKELIASVGPQLGDWPREADHELKYAINGHMDHLVTEGRVVAEQSTYPIQYRLV